MNPPELHYCYHSVQIESLDFATKNDETFVRRWQDRRDGTWYVKLKDKTHAFVLWTNDMWCIGRDYTIKCNLYHSGTFICEVDR